MCQDLLPSIFFVVGLSALAVFVVAVRFAWLCFVPLLIVYKSVFFRLCLVACDYCEQLKNCCYTMALNLVHLKLLREQAHTQKNTKHNIIPSFATSTQNKVVAEFMFFCHVVRESYNCEQCTAERHSGRENEREGGRRREKE